MVPLAILAIRTKLINSKPIQEVLVNQREEEAKEPAESGQEAQARERRIRAKTKVATTLCYGRKSLRSELVEPSFCYNAFFLVFSCNCRHTNTLL
jgi:hypothetical protein